MVVKKARRVWVRLRKPTIEEHLKFQLPPHYTENVEALKLLRDLSRSALEAVEYDPRLSSALDLQHLRKQLDTIEEVINSLQERALEHYKNIPTKPRALFEMSSRSLFSSFPLVVRRLSSTVEKTEVLGGNNADKKKLITYLRVLSLLDPEIARRIGDKGFYKIAWNVSADLKDFIERHKEVIKHLKG